jgi:hypothetical protein
MSHISQSPVSRPAPWRSLGIWMVVALIVYILFSALRALRDPVAFAAGFGLPLANPNNNGFVYVYSIRAVFLGLLGLALLVRRNYSALTLFVLVATVIPIGDAVLVAFNGGGTLIRNVLTAGFLLLTWFFMRRWSQQASAG